MHHEQTVSTAALPFCNCFILYPPRTPLRIGRYPLLYLSFRLLKEYYAILFPVGLLKFLP